MFVGSGGEFEAFAVEHEPGRFAAAAGQRGAKRGIGWHNAPIRVAGDARLSGSIRVANDAAQEAIVLFGYRWGHGRTRAGRLWLDTSALVLAAPIAGSATFSIPIPNAPALVGLSVLAQGAYAPLPVLANPSGIQDPDSELLAISGVAAPRRRR